MTQSPTYETQFGSLSNFEKGGIDIVNDDPRHYAFSNVFDVASRSAPYEKVAVGKNMEYVLEAIRAEGVSPWRTSGHDEFVLVMDGEVEISLIKLDSSPLQEDSSGSVSLEGEVQGRRMGRVVARRGHMTLLPAGAAYRFSAAQPAVLLQQTITSPDTKFRWTEIIQSL